MKKVSIITVNYNQPEATEALLDSIFDTNTYFSLEIIVVDNGSTIDPFPKWKRAYPAVNFIESKKNLGFSGGNNLGIKEAKGDYLFFVNNDTVFTEDLVNTLVDTLDQHPGVGVISPKIKYYDAQNTIQYAGFTAMNYYTARNKCIGHLEKDNGQYNNIVGETGYANGAAMMVRKEAIQKAGTMPENYFLYYEELDWCEHIKKAGYAIWVNTTALIYHKESMSVGASSPMKEYFMNRNRILFIRRNCAFKEKIIFAIYFFSVVAPRNIIRYIKNGQWRHMAMLFKAIMWNVINSNNSLHLGYHIHDYENPNASVPIPKTKSQ